MLVKWSKNKVGAKSTLLNKFNAIFFYLYPDGKIPSGKQKEDMIFAMKANLHRIYKPKEYAALTATQVTYICNNQCFFQLASSTVKVLWNL